MMCFSKGILEVRGTGLARNCVSLLDFVSCSGVKVLLVSNNKSSYIRSSSSLEKIV